MILPLPSEEQLLIINNVLAGNNVKVSAVAGSGKTTAMLMICNALLKSKNVLALTYNSRLKDEMRNKIEQLNLRNAEAHSYHAFFVRYYGSKCCTDSGILDVINRNDPPRMSFRFNCVILDEVQDMTPLYLRAVKKLISDMTNSQWAMQEPTENIFDDIEPTPVVVVKAHVEQPGDFDFTSTAGREIDQPTPTPPPVEVLIDNISVQLCLFGDPSQNIYAFKDADDRFLTLSNYIWKDFPRLADVWAELTLSQSFRLTKHSADFVNGAMLGYKKIYSDKPGKKVKYIICNGFGSKPTNTILALLKIYKPCDFFIIAPSIRSGKSPIKKLENNLVAAGIPCFVPTADDEILLQDVICNKIVFSSIHQTKGLERPVVMLFNFDASYFKFFNKDDESTICPNALYVACTRHKEILIPIHESTREFLPFLDQSYIYSNCEMVIERFNPKPIITSDRSIFSVTDLTRHLTVETVQRLLTKVKILNAEKVNIKEFKLVSPITIPTIIHCDTGDETVSDINGICLPAIYEYKTQCQVSIIEYIKDQKSRLTKQDQIQVEQYLPKFSTGGKCEINDFLYLSNVYNSLRSGYMFKLRQINKYDWLESENVKLALQVIQKYIPVSAKFEQYMISSCNVRGIDRIIQGCIDAISAHEGIIHVWEFKCVKELQPEHIIQLLIYQWLFNRNGVTTPTRFLLLNILTDEILEIVQPAELNEIVEELILEKIKIRHKTTDKEFLNIINSN